MAKKGLKTADGLQEWIFRKAARFTQSCGAQPCAWEEAITGQNGGIGNGAILFAWASQGPGLEAARAGRGKSNPASALSIQQIARVYEPFFARVGWASFS